MNNQPTQESCTIGSPNRFVFDAEGDVAWYETLTLCLERADATIDLAIGYEESATDEPGVRPVTRAVCLYSAQRELDDMRHVLAKWLDKGMPKGCGTNDLGINERDNAAAKSDTDKQADVPEHLRPEYVECLQKNFDDALHVLRGQYGIMRNFGGDVIPPEGSLDGETVQSMGIAGDRAALEACSAFYGVLELHNEQRREVQS